MRIDPGFDYRNVLVVNVGVRADSGCPMARGVRGSREARTAVRRCRCSRRCGRVPGVVAAAAVSGGAAADRQLEPDTGSSCPAGRAGRRRRRLDRPPDRHRRLPADARHSAAPRPVSLRRGSRGLARRSSVINEAAAKKYWPDTDALGQTFKINDQDYTVVGIVGDIRHLGPETPPRQESYVPLAQNTRHRHDAGDAHAAAIRWRCCRPSRPRSGR